MNDQSTISIIYRFLEENQLKFGVISTTGEEAPQVAFVYFATDEDLNIYFVTRTNSRKYKNMMKHPKVAFAVASEKPSGTVQMEGKVETVTDPDLQRVLFPKLVEFAANRTGLAPISQYSTTGEAIFLKVVPTWVRFSDFEVEDKSQIFHEVTFQE